MADDHSQGDDPGEQADRGPAVRSLTTAVHGNSTAFGFSLTVTVTFGLLQGIEGSPSSGEAVMFAVAGALAVTLLSALVTNGFRLRPESSPSEVSMLGTAQDFLSVAAGGATALAVGTLVNGFPAWPAAAYAACTVFLLAEAVEIRGAHWVQRRRGDTDAD